MTDFDTSDAQIVISRSALMEQLGGVARAALFTGGGWMVSKGWLDDGLVQAIVPALMIAGPLLWQQIRIRRSQRMKVKLANKLPDAVAVVK